MLSSRTRRLMLVALAAVIAAGLFWNAPLVSGAPAETAAEKPQVTAAQRSEQLYQELELFTDALAIIDADYVEPPDPQALIYGALKGMLASLDPYSQFMDPDTYKEIKVETEGEFGGLGIEITIKDDLLTVISPIDGTPAYKAGVKAGDKIVKISNELTRDITLLDAVKKLRGKPGTSIQITVLREGEDKLLEFDITRDVIKIESIREAKVVDEAGRIGYIRLSEFQEKTPKDLQDALKKLEDQKIEGLVLDLRDNPGGLLDVAVTVAEHFVPEKAVIVSTAGRLKNQNMEFRARSNHPPVNLPLVVLVNEGSASASEIVAGAVQDHHRGIILGMKSFGKGSVQTVIPMRDGSALRLTTSKYYTPSGRSIHGEGIMPDVVVEPMQLSGVGKDKQSEAVFQEIEKTPDKAPHLPADKDKNKEKDKDKAGGPEAEKPYDNQLARAVDLLKGLKVYQRTQQ